MTYGARPHERSNAFSGRKLYQVPRRPVHQPELVDFEWVELAERVGFEPLLAVDNKEFIGISHPHDPPDPLESRGRDTY